MLRLAAALSLPLFLLLPAGPAGAGGGHDLRVTHLATEYADNPLGIDVATPRLSWTLASGSPARRRPRTSSSSRPAPTGSPPAAPTSGTPAASAPDSR